MSHRRALPVACLIALALGACSGVVPRPVDEVDRDLSGRYDARWTANIDHPGGRQQMGSGWYIDCGAEERTIGFEVNEGRVVSRWTTDDEKTQQFETFVDADGRFRLEVPSSGKFRVIQGTAADDRMTLVLQGSLDESSRKGRFVYAVSQFQNRGCTYPVRFERNS